MKFNICLIILVLSLRTVSGEVNAVQVTTNLLFSLHSREKKGPQSEFKSNDEIIWSLIGTNTNRIWYRHFPAGNFECHLFDQNGNEMPRTKAGLDFLTFPPKPTEYDLAMTKKFVGYSVNNDHGEFRRLFRPNEIFVITNNGIYTLQVQLRLCVIMTNGSPDLTAMIDGRNINGRGFKFAKDFGALTSAPVRVTITHNNQ